MLVSTSLPTYTYREYTSVVAYGTVQLLEELEEKRRAL
jgi:nitroimidazol reductase NimA-like FMN-containing flavoprotein (pyridoxamine 5'-phosphate oxidase superfamily)